MPSVRVLRAVVPALILGIVLAPSTLAPVSSAGPTPATGITSGACPGTSISPSYTGLLAALNSYGGSPSLGNRTVDLDYYFQENATVGGTRSTACYAAVANATTAGSGAFSLTATIPNGSCGLRVCLRYTGPFGPAGFAPADPAPAGDLLRVYRDGTTVDLLWTAAFYAAEVVPGSGTTVSAGAPANFSTTVLAGDGTPSPASLAWHWTLAGPDWSFATPTDGPSAAVEGTAAAAPARLVLFANASYNGTTFPTARIAETVDQVPTELADATLAARSADVGAPINLSVAGTGAAGYRYRASVALGLGGATSLLPCESGAPDAASVVALNCSGSVTFPAAGLARPDVALSNGYSSSNATLPIVSVAPALSITVGPSPAEGYVGRPVGFELTVPPGDGTAPYGPACLETGAGATTCSYGLNGSYALPFAYADPGTYRANLSVRDAAGENRSAALDVAVAELPTLGPLAAPAEPVALGGSASLAASLSGGLRPATFWWNDSLAGGTLATGPVPSNGSLLLSFAPAVPGDHVVSLTVLDAGGTRVSDDAEVAVTPGPPDALARIGSHAPLVGTAGAPLLLGLAAVDRAGGLSSNYSDALRVTLSGPPGAAAGSISVDGEALPALDGAFGVPASAWTGGSIALAVTVTSAGAWTLSADSTGPEALAGLSVPFAIGADAQHATLADPHAARADPRDSETLWRIADGYGNPILTGYIVIESLFPGAASTVRSPVLDANGTGEVWVNFSAPGSAAGTILVLDAFNESLLPSIGVPAAPPALDGTAVLAGAAAALLASAGVGAVRFLDRRRARRPPSDELASELERAAAGREHILRRLAAGPTDSLDHLAGGWDGPGPPPAPAEVAEWVGALVADGSVTARTGPAGRPAFVRPSPPGERPAIVLDDAALERSLAQRDDEPA